MQVDEAGSAVGRMVSLTMPAAMVDALDAAAGRDRECRSGIIRTAVAEWLARSPNITEAPDHPTGNGSWHKSNPGTCRTKATTRKQHLCERTWTRARS